jgi:hypothetical protein
MIDWIVSHEQIIYIIIYIPLTIVSAFIYLRKSWKKSWIFYFKISCVFSVFFYMLFRLIYSYMPPTKLVLLSTLEMKEQLLIHFTYFINFPVLKLLLMLISKYIPKCSKIISCVSIIFYVFFFIRILLIETNIFYFMLGPIFNLIPNIFI